MAESGRNGGSDEAADEAASLGSPYARGLFDHFVTRRSRGTDLSSQDVHLLLSWESSGIPEGWVIEGIDMAFAKLREPPASISECRRYVLKVVEVRREGLAETEAVPAVDEAAESVRGAGIPEPFCEAEPAALTVLRGLCGHSRIEVSEAALGLCAELRLVAVSELVSFDLLLGLEQRLEVAVRSALTEGVVAELEAEAQRMVRRERRGGDALALRRARTRAYRTLLDLPPLV